MRAESRIALVLVTGLLGGLGFFVQDRLKSETDSPDEELAQFLDPTEGEGSATDASEGDPAVATDDDEPPRDLFTSDEYATPRPSPRATTTTGSSAVSPNPFSQTSGVASIGAASRTAQSHSEDADSSNAITWADSDVTQVSGTAPAAGSQNPFASSEASSTRTAATAPARGFTPDDLIAPDQSTEPTDDSSPTTSGLFESSSPFGSEATQVTAAQAQLPAPSATTQRPAQPVFFQTPAPSTSSNSGTTDTGSQASPFQSPAAANSPNPPAAASDPFAPVQTHPAPATGNPTTQSSNPPTFNFSNPATTPTQTQTPAQTTPAPALTPTPTANPFPATTASQQQPSYNPQGLASAPGGDPGTKIYEVAPGDNYWTISRKVYGAGRYFSALAEYNKARIEDPELLAPGMIVLVPTPEILDQRYSAIISSPPPGVGGTAPAGFFVDAAGQPMYRVGDADTLSGIAQTYLGRSSRWVQIYGMNREVIESADALKPGTVLQLPPDAAPIALGPEESVVR